MKPDFFFFSSRSQGLLSLQGGAVAHISSPVFPFFIFFFSFLSFITFIWSLSMTKNLLMDLISVTLQRLLSPSCFFFFSSVKEPFLLRCCLFLPVSKANGPFAVRKRCWKRRKKVSAWKENRNGAWKETPMSVREGAGHLWGGRCFCFAFLTSLRNVLKSGILSL